MSHRVHIVCSNLNILKTGIIDAANRGYKGGTGQGIDGYGPGAGKEQVTTTAEANG
jgi:hypothetical protein